MTNDISWDFHTNSTLCWTVSCRRCFALLLSASRCESTAGRELSDNRYRMRSEWKRCSLAWHCVCKFVGKDRRGVHTHTHTHTQHHPTFSNLWLLKKKLETWPIFRFGSLSCQIWSTISISLFILIGTWNDHQWKPAILASSSISDLQSDTGCVPSFAVIL